jgi:hypothetical protein
MKTKIAGSRFVLAVNSLAKSADFYRNEPGSTTFGEEV